MSFFIDLNLNAYYGYLNHRERTACFLTSVLSSSTSALVPAATMQFLVRLTPFGFLHQRSPKDAVKCHLSVSM